MESSNEVTDLSIPLFDERGYLIPPCARVEDLTDAKSYCPCQQYDQHDLYCLILSCGKKPEGWRK